MSGAREALYMALWDNYTPVEKNRFIAAYAHELAEKIRAAGPAVCDGFAGDCLCGCEAADLIDPEVSE